MHDVAFGYTPTYLQDAVVPVSMLPGRTNASAVGRQWTVRRTTGVIVSRFQSFFCCFHKRGIS